MSKTLQYLIAQKTRNNDRYVRRLKTKMMVGEREKKIDDSKKENCINNFNSSNVFVCNEFNNFNGFTTNHQQVKRLIFCFLLLVNNLSNIGTTTTKTSVQ